VKALEGLKAMAKAKPMMASPMLDEESAEGEDPARERLLGHADDLIAAIKAGDREMVADVLEACTGGYESEE
jgi:hypothetical protein